MSDFTFRHQPVLFKEVIENLALKPDGIYLDATFGRGGHAKEILRRLDNRGRLLVIDKDIEAIKVAKAIQDGRLEVICGSFANLKNFVESLGWQGAINGILFDLGVSSPQLDDGKRGFSFLQDGPLDMRMDKTQALTAAKWLNQASISDMVKIFKQYGEERYSRRIAEAIFKARSKSFITTTKQLAVIVCKAHPKWSKNRHPATKVFQALRILVNNELVELKEGLEQALEVLAIRGRLLVLSFHSLEDRIVKDFIKKYTTGTDLPPQIPITKDLLQKRLITVGKAIRASASEVENNPRSRSATLRIMEKIA